MQDDFRENEKLSLLDLKRSNWDSEVNLPEETVARDEPQLKVPASFRV